MLLRPTLRSSIGSEQLMKWISGNISQAGNRPQWATVLLAIITMACEISWRPAQLPHRAHDEAGPPSPTATIIVLVGRWR
jgi:hypothetical protein